MPRKANSSKPKGRMGSYAYFMQTCREEHRKRHADEQVAFLDFSRGCAQRWKVMSEKEKKRFKDMATRDKMRYESEMEGYVPSDDEGSRPKGGKGSRGGKRKKDPNAPKRSLSAFLWFCNDERPKVKAANPDFGIGDMGKMLGHKWGGVTPAVKNKYQAMADRDKARYEREMAAYKKKSGKGGK